MKAPRTPHEWQEAVDLAEFYLLVDSAQKFGMVTGGPRVDVDRCEQLLAAGLRRGVRPAPNAELCARFLHRQLAGESEVPT